MLGGVELSDMVPNGVAVVVATVDGDGRPAIARAWGPAYHQPSSALTVNVGAPAGSPTLANLVPGAAIAVTISEPLTYHTVQLKGTVESVGAPSDQDWATALEHLARFTDTVAQLGMDDRVEELFGGEIVHVRIDVTDRFLQTPGAAAGSRLG